MIKVGILTLYKNNKNYGGLLQAYSLQKVISNMGYDCEMVSYEQDKKKYLIKRALNLGLFRTAKFLLNKIRNNLLNNNYEVSKNINKRNDIFKKFENSIPHSIQCNEKNISQVCIKYSILICGSDQVWNPGLWSKPMFLNIKGDFQKKIAYAASFGREYLTNSEIRYVKNQLNNLDNISVREKSAINLINNMGKMDVKYVLDPTLLISSNEWRKFSIRPKDCPDKYIFNLFLEKGEQNRKCVYDIFKNKIPIVTIPHLQNSYKEEDELYSDIKLYDVGPQEWVWLINNAKYIFTDSFHVVAYSINLNKNFWAFPKENENDLQKTSSRIIDLLNLCNLKERYVSDIKDLNNIYSDDIDYKDANYLLEKERKKSYEYLIEGLKI